MDHTFDQSILPADARPRFQPAILLAMIAAVFCLSHTWSNTRGAPGFDFYQFWVVGRDIKSSENPPVYTQPWREEMGKKYRDISHGDNPPERMMVVTDMRRVLETYSTPLLYSFFSRIGVNDYARSLQIFQIVLFSSAILGITILCRLLAFSATSTVLAVALLLGYNQPFISDLFVGNVNEFQLLLVALLFWVEVRMDGWGGDLLGGTLLAALVTFKPNLLPVAGLLGVMWLSDSRAKRLVRHALAFVPVAALLVYLSGRQFGSLHCWIDWLPAVKELGMTHPDHNTDNCAVLQIIREHIGPAVADITGILLLLAAPVYVWYTRRSVASSEGDAAARRHRTFLVIAIGYALPLFTSPIAWLHYFVAITPLMLWAARPRFTNRSRDSLAVVSYTVAVFAIIACSYSRITSEWLWLDDTQGRAAKIIAAGVAVLALAINELRYYREILPSPVDSPADALPAVAVTPV